MASKFSQRKNVVRSIGERLQALTGEVTLRRGRFASANAEISDAISDYNGAVIGVNTLLNRMSQVVQSLASELAGVNGISGELAVMATTYGTIISDINTHAGDSAIDQALKDELDRYIAERTTLISQVTTFKSAVEAIPALDGAAALAAASTVQTYAQACDDAANP